MDPSTKLSRDEEESLKDPFEYGRLIGRLLYLTITRPDLSYLVNYLSQFMVKPQDLHLKALNRVLQYEKDTVGQGLFFSSKSEPMLKAFVDYNWVSCPDSRRSIYGF